MNKQSEKELEFYHRGQVAAFDYLGIYLSDEDLKERKDMTDDPVTGLPSPPPDWFGFIFYTALLIYLGYKLF